MEMNNKTIWNSSSGLLEYPLPLFGIEKRVQLVIIAAFSKYLCANPGQTYATTYCFSYRRTTGASSTEMSALTQA